MRTRSWLLVGFAVLLLGAGPTLAQDPGGGKRGRGGDPSQRGGRGGFGDPSQFFDKLSGGKDVWIRAEITDERRQMFFDKIAQNLGVTNGQISREQFSAGMQQMRANGPQRGAPAAPVDPKVVEQDAERKFKDLDQNGDGYINMDEAARSKSLSAEFSRWDANKDGLIDLNEYKAYYQARQQARGQNDPGYGAAAIVPEPEEERRPVVYRFGNLPKELPPWFTQLDTDKDGQVGLYEWRKAGKPLDEFEEMDRNNDGFLTAEEVLYYLAINKKNADPTAGPQVASAAAPYGAAAMPSPGIGARPSFTRQPGGPGGGFKGKKGGGLPGGKRGGKDGGFKGKRGGGTDN